MILMSMMNGAFSNCRLFFLKAHLVRLAVGAEDIILARANAARHARRESNCNRRKQTNDRKKSDLPEETAPPETQQELPPPFEKRLLKTLVNSTAAQSSLVADQLVLLRGLRAEAARHIGLDYEAKTLFLDRPPENAERTGSDADAGETGPWGSVDVGAGAGLGEDEFEELGEGEREARWVLMGVSRRSCCTFFVHRWTGGQLPVQWSGVCVLACLWYRMLRPESSGGLYSIWQVCRGVNLFTLKKIAKDCTSSPLPL